MTNEEKQSINNLKKYIEEDFAYREPLKNYSDFDRFCYNHCKDIETVLNLIEKHKIREEIELIKELRTEIEELKQDRDKFKKVLGKRITYCNELEKDLFENCNNYVIAKSKIQDKIDEPNKQIEELKKNAFSKGLDEVGFDFWITELNKAIAKRNVLQELLEKRK